MTEAHFDLRRITTDRYLTTVLKEAERVAEQHDQVARSTDKQAHEYLRYNILRVLEGGSSEDWWETVPPQDACTRFRVFFPDDHQTVPRVIVDVMAALGA